MQGVVYRTYIRIFRIYILFIKQREKSKIKKFLGKIQKKFNRARN